MTQYRWTTPAIFGRWLASRRLALYDALRAKQAIPARSGHIGVTLLPFTTIETRGGGPAY